MKEVSNIMFLLGVYVIGIVLILLKTISNYKEEVKSLKEENRVLKNEVQLREDEISYWGMKYDSICKTNIIIE